MIARQQYEQSEKIASEQNDTLEKTRQELEKMTKQYNNLWEELNNIRKEREQKEARRELRTKRKRNPVGTPLLGNCMKKSFKKSTSQITSLLEFGLVFVSWQLLGFE